MANEGIEGVWYTVQDRLGCALRGARRECALRGRSRCQNSHLVISKGNPQPPIVRKQL